MNRTSIKRTAPLAALLAIGIVGCAKDEDTAIVTGKVTIDGELLERGTVAFHPAESGKIAYGQIQPDGSYSLRVGRGRGGLPPGDYKVVVSARMDPMHGISEGGGPPDPGEPITPARYADAKTTPLVKTVRDGENVIDLTLEWTEQDRAAAEAAAAAEEERDTEEMAVEAEATAEDEQPVDDADAEADEDAEADVDEDSASESNEGEEGEETDVDESPDASEASAEEKPAADDPPPKPNDESGATGDSESTANGKPSSEGQGS